MQGITSIDYLYCFYYINTYLSGSGLTVIFVCNPIINKIKKNHRAQRFNGHFCLSESKNTTDNSSYYYDY